MLRTPKKNVLGDTNVCLRQIYVIGSTLIFYFQKRKNTNILVKFVIILLNHGIQQIEMPILMRSTSIFLNFFF
jgi:hypothetical protein